MAPSGLRSKLTNPLCSVLILASPWKRWPWTHTLWMYPAENLGSALQKDAATMVNPHYLLAGFGVTWKHDPGCAMRTFPEMFN